MSDIPCQTAVDTKALEASQDRVATCSPPSPAGTGCGSEAISSSRPHRPKLEDLENLTNPTGAFLREVCEIGPGRQVECSLLFCYWRAWAEKQNRQHAGTVQAFGVNIRASMPGLRISQPRHEGGRARCYEGIALKPDHDSSLRVIAEALHDAEDKGAQEKTRRWK